MGQGAEKSDVLQKEMAKECTSCGECVRPCAFLQQQGTPADIAQRGAAADNLLSAYGCSLCGLCDAVCPERLSPSALFLAMRQEAAAQELIDLKPYQPWLNYEKLGSHPLFRRELIPAGCTTVFFPGCSLPGTRPDAVRGLYRMVLKQDATIGLVLDCCGKISHDLGLTVRFEQIFKKLADRLQQNGITRILTACPGCSKILRKHGDQFEVVSVYEVLLEGQGSRVKGQKTTEVIGSHIAPCPLPHAPVVIHDPCPARFDTAQQNAVRQLVQMCGYSIEELPSHGVKTRCCGQGGMVDGCVPGTVKQESMIIATEAAGRPVVSSCAACSDTLAAATPAGHIVDLLTNTTNFSAKPLSSARRWLNRLKLRFERLA
jgi:Fe-S oxidoreductase